MTMEQRGKLWKEVAGGVGYLHSLEPVLVHGDLKTANVLIDDHGKPQICDFGLISIYLEEGNSGMTTTSPHTGTDRYLAYELLQDHETVAPTTASDIFALGCIGLEFCFLRIPYANRKNNLRFQIWGDIKAGKPPAERPSQHPSSNEAEMGDILDKCWSQAPYERPSAQSLLIQLDKSFDSNKQKDDLYESVYSFNTQMHKIEPTTMHVIENPITHQQKPPLPGNASAGFGDECNTFGMGVNLKSTRSAPVPVRIDGHYVMVGSSSSARFQPPQLSHTLRTTSIPKRRQQGQRNEVDEEKLAGAFLEGLHRPDPALRLFLQTDRKSVV